jgi:hypothetical protein
MKSDHLKSFTIWTSLPTARRKFSMEIWALFHLIHRQMFRLSKMEVKTDLHKTTPHNSTMDLTQKMATIWVLNKVIR